MESVAMVTIIIPLDAYSLRDVGMFSRVLVRMKIVYWYTSQNHLQCAGLHG